MIDFGFFLTLIKKRNFDQSAPHIIFKDEIIHPEIPNCFSSDDLFNFINIYRPSTPDFQALSEIVKISEYEINNFDICKIDSFTDSKRMRDGYSNLAGPVHTLSISDALPIE